MTIMNINVKQLHIDTGTCKSPQKCAIAQAIRENRPDVSYVAVRTNGITITSRVSDGGDGTRRHFAVPLSAAKAIIAFDAGESVGPFRFIAKLIDEVAIKCRTEQQKKKDRAKTKKRRVKREAAGLTQEPTYGRRSRIAGV